MTHVIITVLEGFLTIVCSLLNGMDTAILINDPINITVLDFFLSWAYLGVIVSFYRIMTNKEDMIYYGTPTTKGRYMGNGVTMYNEVKRK